MNKKNYIPKPIDTSGIELPPELKKLGAKIDETEYHQRWLDLWKRT